MEENQTQMEEKKSEVVIDGRGGKGEGRKQDGKDVDGNFVRKRSGEKMRKRRKKDGGTDGLQSSFTDNTQLST